MIKTRSAELWLSAQSEPTTSNLNDGYFADSWDHLIPNLLLSVSSSPISQFHSLFSRRQSRPAQLAAADGKWLISAITYPISLCTWSSYVARSTSQLPRWKSYSAALYLLRSTSHYFCHYCKRTDVDINLHVVATVLSLSSASGMNSKRHSFRAFSPPSSRSMHDLDKYVRSSWQSDFNRGATKDAGNGWEDTSSGNLV